MRAARSFGRHEEVAIASSFQESIAFVDSYALPRFFASDHATHFLSWNDLGSRSEGEDLYHRREASIARV